MQKTKTITGVLLSVNPHVNPHNANAEAKIVTYRDCLEEMYRLIGCECFDCTTLKLGDQLIDAYVDDEGLMKEPPIALTYIGGRELAGNILLIGHDDEGNSVSLTKEQIDIISSVLSNGLHFFIME